MLSLTLSLLFLLGTPGPGVMSLAGVGAAFGYRQAWIYGIGLFTGSNIVMAMAATGLAAFLLAQQEIRIIFLVVSSGWLVFLAARIALAGSIISFAPAKKEPGFIEANFLQIVNPKAYALGLFIFSGFPIVTQSYLAEVIIKFIILNVIWIPIHIIWMIAGVSLQKLNPKRSTQKIINYCMATALVVVVAIAFYASFVQTQ